ncbi:MAG: histidine phosphatase family protein [Candidatus Electryonea clarkiae]|nr:histidine phosphatase family protein [Candidatus Electryonea clarkiae]MDP8286828.1 histidine phosphatase family protein [Candidatus Electryonea clarkiae]
MSLLYLCRHAESVANAEEWVSGCSDVPLTEKGYLQASELAEALSRDGTLKNIISSDLSRAKNTAETIREKLGGELLLDKDLRERDYGQWTGTPYQVAFVERKAEWERLRQHDDIAPPGGETQAEHRVRIFRALKRAHRKWQHGFIVVTHRGVIRLLFQTLGIMEDGKIPSPPNPPMFIKVDWKP